MLYLIFRLCFNTLIHSISWTVVLSGVQFSLESQVEDETKKADKNRAVGVPRMAAAPESSQVEDQGMASFDSTVTDMNRSTRRMKQRLGTDKDKK